MLGVHFVDVVPDGVGGGGWRVHSVDLKWDGVCWEDPVGRQRFDLFLVCHVGRNQEVGPFHSPRVHRKKYYEMDTNDWLWTLPIYLGFLHPWPRHPANVGEKGTGTGTWPQIWLSHRRGVKRGRAYTWNFSAGEHKKILIDLPFFPISDSSMKNSEVINKFFNTKMVERDSLWFYVYFFPPRALLCCCFFWEESRSSPAGGTHRFPWRFDSTSKLIPRKTFLSCHLLPKQS